MVMNRGDRTVDTAWVSLLAEQLICEIAEQMGAIRLNRLESGCPPDNAGGVRYAVQARIGGDYNILTQLLADHAFFYRLARNMLGEEPEQEDIRTYAVEFVNVVCGRFISELVNKANFKVQLMPIEGGSLIGDTSLSGEDIQSMHFISDEHEYAELSWTYLPIEEMLRRGMSE